MNIIFSMCLTGSVLFLLYLLVIGVLKNRLSNSWRYLILKIVVFFFLTPLGFLKMIPNKLSSEIDFTVAGTLPITVSTSQGIYSNGTYQIHHIIVYAWSIMAAIMFIWQQAKYMHFKIKIKQSLTEIVNLEESDAFFDCQSFIKSRNIHFFRSNLIGPFTIGVFLPFIVLPDNLPAVKHELILKHELCHIRRYDTFFLFLLHLVTCFYWFNPLIYLLKIHAEQVVEASCDEFVIRNMGLEQRRTYASLIIDMTARNVQYQKLFVPSFGSSVNNLKERIEFIMTSEKRKKPYNKYSVILAAIMVLCSSFTAFAYQPSIELSVDCAYNDSSFWKISPSDTVAFQSGVFYHEVLVTSILYDDQFTDIHGNIYKVESFSIAGYSACEHNYVDGSISRHSLKSNGGCAVKYYNAKRCSKCGHIVQGNLVKTETYEICPH